VIDHIVLQEVCQNGHRHRQRFAIIREGDPKRWSIVLITALGRWGKNREGDPKGWSTVLITALGSWGKRREVDLKGWSTVPITALGSWEKPVPHGHHQNPYM
jgi:hypothetical protein